MVTIVAFSDHFPELPSVIIIVTIAFDQIGTFQNNLLSTHENHKCNNCFIFIFKICFVCLALIARYYMHAIILKPICSVDFFLTSTSCSKHYCCISLSPQMVPGGGTVPTMQRIPLPGAEMLEEEPLYVNAKQYHRILKRRQARAKLEAEGKIPKERRVGRGDILVLEGQVFVHASNV